MTAAWRIVMSDQAEARAVCEHFYASHCYRGMSIKLCMMCHQPDWDDLERQLHPEPEQQPRTETRWGVAVGVLESGGFLGVLEYDDQQDAEEHAHRHGDGLVVRRRVDTWPWQQPEAGSDEEAPDGR
jgi:hypothetical protein